MTGALGSRLRFGFVWHCRIHNVSRVSAYVFKCGVNWLDYNAECVFMKLQWNYFNSTTFSEDVLEFWRYNESSGIYPTLGQSSRIQLSAFTAECRFLQLVDLAASIANVNVLAYPPNVAIVSASSMTILSLLFSWKNR